MVALDAEPSRSRQVPLVRDIGDFLETDHVGLPLFQRPTLTVWRSDRLAGPIGEFASSPYSSYWNMFEWEGVDVEANAAERSE